MWRKAPRRRRSAIIYNAYIEATQRPTVDLGDLKTHELAVVKGVAAPADFWPAVAKLGPAGVEGPLGIWIATDFKDSEAMTVYLSQGGLTLPDRDYYLKDEPRYLKARQLYQGYASGMFETAGFEAPDAEAMLAFETKLAQASWPREKRRDPRLMYNPRGMEGLGQMAPKVPWQKMLGASGVGMRQQYIVGQPSYVEAVGEIVAGTKPKVLRDYLRLQVLGRYAAVLGRPMFERSFAFRGKGLRGVEQPRPAWKRALARLDRGMGELLGQVYVSRHFRPEAKERMGQLVEQLIKAYASSIEQLDWMSPQTKEQALAKLGAFRAKIGYPDTWRDYGALQIGHQAVANERAVARFDFERDVAKLDRPIDKQEWGMPPQQVNAYYNALWNEIVFPAAILQPPFFNLEADDAVNYGAIGAVIGHEIGHGFDDQGRKFDANGTLNDWWSEEDAAAFEAKKQALKAQYDAFEVLDGQRVNGEFTSGENIGDLAGLSIAYKAYKASLGGKKAPVIDGFTGDQRFFMGWAQVWRRLYTDKELERRLTVDPHAPSKARTNVVLRNIPAFYEAFGVKPGDGMYLPPEQRVEIW